MEDKNLSLTEHLNDLRKVFTVSLTAILIMSAVSYFAFGEQLLDLISNPLKSLNVKLVYIGMAEAFITKIKIAVLGGVVLAMPVILWQVWQFVGPALFPHERRFVLLVVPLSIILFVMGVVFAYLVVFNFAARFLLVVVSGDLVPMLSVGHYVSFLIAFLIPFGLVFELPMVVYFLTKLGIINHRWMAKNRKFAVLIFFILGAVLTPPDVISQTLLAGPMLVLYEISVIIARFVKPRQKSEEAVQES
ncbi:MAG: twin-arginine translocase subunit TatC [Thermoanaerobacteraceae bacterium]|nr:twin-arginine translocase subunit TatC [Thermoanaerobacteraceae bacterium]